MNSQLKNMWQKTKNSIDGYFFNNKFSASSLFILRIGLGIIILLQLFHLRNDLFILVGKNGLIRQDIAGVQIAPGLLSSDKLVNFLMLHLNMGELSVLNLLGIIYMVSAVMLTMGLFTRFSAFVCWLLHLAFVVSGHFFTYGVDYFITMLLFYCILFPVGREFSIDNLLFKYKQINYAPYIRALQIHLCIVYLVSGVVKAFSINWWNGVSVLKAVDRPNTPLWIKHFSHGNVYLLFAAIGILTVLVEALYPIFINYTKTRKLWMLLTCMMHISIAFVLQLPYFAAVMVLMNAVAFHYPYYVGNKQYSAETKFYIKEHLPGLFRFVR